MLTVGASNGVVKITHVQINGGGDQEHVAPGASFAVSFDYTITHGCPNCREQIEVGLAGGPPTACAYDNIPASMPADSGFATVNLTAPTTAGAYYVAFDKASHYTCGYALGLGNWWSFSSPAPQTNYIAGIAVY